MDSNSTYIILDPEGYTKTLGLEWNTNMDLPPLEKVTKYLLISDIGVVCSYSSQSKDPVTTIVGRENWLGWPRTSSHPWGLVAMEVWTASFGKQNHPSLLLSQISSSHFIPTLWFCDASELAYAGVVYLWMVDSEENVQVALVTSKTKVALIKRLTIPRLELCGAQLLAQLLFHVREALHIPIQDVHAWTDSTIVLSWLEGNPRRFKTYHCVTPQ